MKLILKKTVAAESFVSPRYAEWAKELMERNTLCLLTNAGRRVIMILSRAFKDNGGLPEGTLILSYGMGYRAGYAELDFTRPVTHVYLFGKGFPLELSVLICKAIYSMFPHLNPLTEEDKRILDAATKKSPKATRALRLSYTKTSKKRNKKSAVDTIP
jgi:hypothetical protein